MRKGGKEKKCLTTLSLSVRISFLSFFSTRKRCQPFSFFAIKQRERKGPQQETKVLSFFRKFSQWGRLAKRKSQKDKRVILHPPNCIRSLLFSPFKKTKKDVPLRGFQVPFHVSKELKQKERHHLCLSSNELTPLLPTTKEVKNQMISSKIFDCEEMYRKRYTLIQAEPF